MPASRILCYAFTALLTAASLSAQTAADIAKLPWMTPAGRALSPDQRAAMVVKEMTIDEKLQLTNGTGWGVLIPPRARPSSLQLRRRLSRRHRPARHPRHQ